MSRRITYIVVCVLLAGMAQAHSGMAQQLDQEITLEVRDVALGEVLKKIEAQAGVKFVYGDLSKKIRDEKLSVTVQAKKLRDVLNEILTPRQITYVVSAEATIVLRLADLKKKADSTQVAPVYNGTISGTVTDAATGEPLPGVTVMVKGTTVGVISDAEGRYSIDAANSSILIFSFIGYKPQEVTVSAQTILDVALQSDEKTLAVVVVNAGYYDVKKTEATGNISRVSSEVIERQPINNPIAALSGRMPGVFIQQTNGMPGADFRIEIRGRNSLRSSATRGDVIDGNEPLYIVDGVPFSSQKVSNRESTQDFLIRGISPLTSINPADIESIEVLKDADATAIYGSRGANGVVLITTKKGKAGKTKFDFTAYTGGGKAPLVNRLNTQQYIALRKEAFANAGITPSADPDDQGYAPDLMIWDTTRYTNWPELAMGGTAVTTSIQGSVSGGNEFTQFLFTVGYRKEGSVLLGDPSYQKGSSHLSVNHLSANGKFFINLSVSGTLDSNDQTAASPSQVAIAPPNAPALWDKDGELNWEGYTWDNPLARLNGTYEGRTRSLISNAVIGYEILPDVRIKSSFGLNSLSSKEVTLMPSTIYSPALGRTSAVSYITIGSGGTLSWIIEPQLTWEKKIANGQLSVLAGGTLQEQQHERSSTSYHGFPSNAMLRNINAASRIIPGIFGSNSLYRYAAFFARLNYNWKAKYIVNLTGRRDGSSRFGPGRQFANFGAMGAAWIFSEESFIKNNIGWLSFGKLRGSYGITGSDQIGDYQYLDMYSTGALGSTYYQGNAGLTLTKLFNPSFGWETNRKLEGAVELGFLQDRIVFNIAYYRNRSSSQLVDYTLPMTTGFTGVLANFPATIQNTGIEVELTTENIKRAITWTTSFNVTVPRNKLLEFPDLEASTYAISYVVGKPIYIRRLYESTGVDPQTGLYTFTDFDGNGLITEADMKKTVFVGYDFFGGLNNSVSFKQWRLDIFFQYVKQTGYNYWNGSVDVGYQSNSIAYILEGERWRQPGDIANIQRARLPSDLAARNTAIWFSQSDQIISDASFIRLRNISLTYQLPQRWTKTVTGNIYVQGQNLFLFTRYKGLDPESQQNNQGLGPLRILSVGFQIMF